MNPGVYRYDTAASGDKTEFTTTVISNNDRIVLEKQKSPYLVRKDIFIDEEGELVVEHGVTVLFAPTVGITVKGILTAKVILIISNLLEMHLG